MGARRGFTLKAGHNGLFFGLSPSEQCVSGQTLNASLSFFEVDDRQKLSCIGRQKRLSAFCLSEFSSTVGIAARLKHVQLGVNGVQSTLGVGDQRAGERTQFVDQVRATFRGAVLIHRDVIPSENVDHAAMGAHSWNHHIQTRPIGLEVASAEKSLPMESVHALKQSGRSVRQRHQETLGQLNALGGQIPTNSVQWKMKPVFLINQPGQKVRRHLGPGIRSGWSQSRSPPLTVIAGNGLTNSSTNTGVLFDHSEFVCDDLVHDA